ncbi:MAG: bacillithiol biosynthesis cysteine-adding enzyme BshC [Planctomycetes bacterium]|nr:bacillithiol biosynthesis cysteine-adding enzyme BshC [Planctomycetota bacterium]NUQ35485.1 bacillithiol biosynthesis cysteine-adding enzyme BshC [Planctomycetaceae bacterium]
MAITELLPREEALGDAAGTLSHAYVRDFDSVADLYASDYRTLDALRRRTAGLSGSNAFPHLERETLARTLTSYLRALRAPAQSMAAVQKLREPDCFAVVTGQQPGIAGGPAFLLYKAAHILRLAEELNEAGVKAVPVFWIASEDHDIDEVNIFGAFDAEQRFRTLKLKSLTAGAPLEKMKLPDISDPDVAKMRELIGHGPARDEALALFDASFGVAPGKGLARLLLRLFGGRGLIVLEPRLLRGMKGFHHVVAHEISHANENTHAVETQLVEVRNRGYMLPLDASPHSNIFLIARGKRRHVTRAPDGFTVDGRARPLSRDELLEMLEDYPTRFSTNVRLRPLVQGACLPTLAYLGGPAEIAYHGALKPLFARAGVTMPALLPRWSFMLGAANAETGKVRDAIQRQKGKARKANAAIIETQTEARAIVSELQRELGHLATALGNDIERIHGRLEKTLLELKGRIAADPFGATALDRESPAALRWLQPGNAPQERMLSWLSVWPDWRDQMLDGFKNRSAFDFSLAVVDCNGR